MNKKFLLRFDEELKKYFDLNLPIPEIRREEEDDLSTGEWFCSDCDEYFPEGDSCNCVDSD